MKPPRLLGPPARRINPAICSLVCFCVSLSSAAQSGARYDIILRGGTIYDGSGSKPYAADLALQDDRIAAIGDLARAEARQTINVADLAVAPGFINVMNLKLKERGALRSGWLADVVVFDPAKIQDHATFEKPHQYATGMVHVFVNGVPVLCDGEHTGAKPGRFVRGPGWRPK